VPEFGIRGGVPASDEIPLLAPYLPLHASRQGIILPNPLGLDYWFWITLAWRGNFRVDARVSNDVHG
jgi:hypothetical protein